MDASRQVLAKMWKGVIFSNARRCVCGAAPRRLLRSVLCQSAVQLDTHHQVQVRHVASLAEQFKIAHDTKPRKPVYRTQNNNPLTHSANDEGLHYTIPQQAAQQIIQKALPSEFRKQAKTFGETSMIVRQPVLEAISYIKQLNLDHPPAKILFYGKRGSGRSMSLLHIMHYCYEDQWVFVYAPWPADWTRNYKEMSQSGHKSDRIDLAVESVEWLQDFRIQNQHLLKDTKIQSSYYWTKRESAVEGSPILDIVEFGLNRTKFATDCVGVILKELKMQANQKKLKVLVAIDGVNSLWADTTMKTELREMIPADKISLVHNFKKMLKNDWTNGLIVCTVDAEANHRELRENYTPQYLLGKEGFDWMEPFLPVFVPYFSEKEAYSCLEYFLDMNWLQSPGAKTEEGKKEIIFLSNKNPYQLIRLCAAR